MHVHTQEHAVRAPAEIILYVLRSKVLLVKGEDTGAVEQVLLVIRENTSAVEQSTAG